MVCDESVKSQRYCGEENALREYFVHDSNLEKHIAKRNILGQILFASKEEYTIIDYDEKIHKFFKDFTSNFQILKSSVSDFFDKEKIVFNILNQSDLKLLTIPEPPINPPNQRNCSFCNSNWEGDERCPECFPLG